MKYKANRRPIQMNVISQLESSSVRKPVNFSIIFGILRSLDARERPCRAGSSSWDMQTDIALGSGWQPDVSYSRY